MNREQNHSLRNDIELIRDDLAMIGAAIRNGNAARVAELSQRISVRSMAMARTALPEDLPDPEAGPLPEFDTERQVWR
jgi:hypothetical protein